MQESGSKKDYASLVDNKFLEAMDIKVTQAPKCPWQFFVTHPDLEHRFAYYPSTGSVVYEGESGSRSSYHANDAEELLEIVMSKVNK